MSAQPKDGQAPDLVNVEIDGQALTGAKGAMLIEVADAAGIQIPRFCYHKKLSIAANCRMCLVDVEKAPKPMPACATPIMEGMKVYTQSKRALDAQRNVMEFLLINHPLDCPICDQGGECELQDLAMGYGRSVSRFTERKRVVADENLGPLVSTDMTRCIHCTRCVRFLHEVAGTTEMGGMGRGEHLEISTYIGRSLASEVSGNIIDVCPVGALTNKVFRFRARPWELTARQAIGYHDALGGNLWLHLRRGEVLRVVPRENEGVNECWLSDRDRYCNLRHELPLVSQRVLKACKAGAVVHAINPVEFDFPYAVSSTQCVAPSKLADALQGVVDGEGDLREALESARSAVIFVGEIAETHPQASRIHAAVRALAEATGARVNRIPLGANAVGLAAVDVLPTAANAVQMLADKRGAYLLYGIEPGADFGDNTLAARALGEARVVAFSHYACTSTRDLADVILPIALLPEIDATLVNVDGIAQRTLAGGKLPGEARPGWRVLRALADALGLPGFEFVDLAGLRAGVTSAARSSGTDVATAASLDGEGLERITTTPIYRGDAVLRRSAALNAHPLTRGARAVLHPEDASAQGLSDGAIAKFDDGRGRAALPVGCWCGR
jgi:NADH dehydrogenase/NADH:ubiquinone oxidoreductase subunit G